MIEVYYMAGLLAFKFQNEPNLTSADETNVEEKPPYLILTKSVREGIIKPPSKKWLEDVAKMHFLFEKHHPLPNLKQGPGLFADFTQKLVQAFPTRNIKLLKEFTKIRTNQQIRALNIIAKGGKKTIRGARNLAQTINS